VFNLLDKNKQIELNECRLKEEYDRYFEIRSRIGILSLFYSIFAAYTIQLVRFVFLGESHNLLLIALFLIYIIFLGLSLFNVICLLIPKEIAFKNLPKYFYGELLDEYKKKKMNKDHLKFYVRETYQDQLETAVERNFNLNNKKSKQHYYAFTFALIALIPYFICVGLEVFNSPNDVVKVEIVNNDLGEKIMCENQDNQSETGNANGESSPEPTIDPEQVIHTEPVMIKENKKDSSTKTKSE